MAKTAKRKLSDISFDHLGAHLALCSKSQGAANNHNNALIMKSSANFSEEIIQKAQEIRVTLSVPEFLQRFFHLYGEDAYILASLMGYVEEEKEVEDEDSYENYIKEKISSFEVMKSLYLSDSFAEAMSKISGEDYLALLKDQVEIEKAILKEKTPVKEDSPVIEPDKETLVLKARDFVKYTKGSTEVVAQVLKSEGDSPVLVKLFKQLSSKNWEPTDVLTYVEKANLIPVKISLTDKITKESKTMEPEIGVELIEKSKFDKMEADATETKVALEKALQKLSDLEKKEKELVRKSKFDALSNVVKDTAVATVLFKALELVEDQAIFDEVLGTVKGLMAATENSEMFIEKGASSDASVSTESAVAKRLKEKYKK